MNKDWMDKAAQHAEKIFNNHGVKLTLGGEPTYVPIEPSGAEWSYAAVGPTKLDYAWRVANDLVIRRLPGAVTFFCPGKSYPGEVNPRWALRIIANRDGSPVFQYSEEASTKHPSSLSGFRSGFCRALGVGNHWVKFAEADKSRGEAWALPLDHDGEDWVSGEWPIPERDRVLSAAEGPAGLRLPLHTIPEPLAKRVLSIERKGTHIAIFVPPLLQPAFLELLAAIEKAASRTRPGQIEFQGYIPSDDEHPLDHRRRGRRSRRAGDQHAAVHPLARIRGLDPRHHRKLRGRRPALVEGTVRRTSKRLGRRQSPSLGWPERRRTSVFLAPALARIRPSLLAGASRARVPFHGLVRRSLVRRRRARTSPPATSTTWKWHTRFSRTSERATIAASSTKPCAISRPTSRATPTAAR